MQAEGEVNEYLKLNPYPEASTSRKGTFNALAYENLKLLFIVLATTNTRNWIIALLVPLNNSNNKT